jgi:serine/threonine-protein kinase PknG
VVLEVPESKRFCLRCGQPVGRGKDGKPGLTKGFCPRCGTSYMFTPPLVRGELVGKEQRYEIIRCIARGGQGWIYLARDHNLGDNVVEHRVVLKGLIDTDDESAVRQAINERHYLLEVKHQNIVSINDFVQHPDPRTGRQAGYIVMEYIDGWSLQELYRQHRDANGQRAPLPLPHVLAYGLDVLLALGHLHGKGLLYCDFKPENALYTGTQLKLIDLGAVVRASDPGPEWLLTPGFHAPEIEKLGPSVASDLYTVGRTLAVLSLVFAGFSTEYRYRLPDPATTPLLAAQESFYRLLRRATHHDRSRRFASAEEMRGQLEGVLLEVLSTADEVPRPTVSTQFTVEQRTFGTDADTVTTPSPDTMFDEDETGDKVYWTAVPHALPAPLVDPKDPGAVHLAAIAATDPDDMVGALRSIPVQSPEVQLQLVGVQIAEGDLDAAGLGLADYAATAPAGDWRVAWYRGVAALTAGRPAEARPHFDAVYDALPGELPPKLALAAAVEWDGDDERAGVLYKRVWRTDASYVSAAFGLARVLRRRGDLAGAVAALDGVPDTSSQHVLAQVAAIRARLTARLTARLAKADLLDAADRLKRLRMGIERQAHMSIKVLSAALEWVSGNGDSGSDLSGTVLGRALDERQLRFGLEKAYRELATVTEDADRRIALVKQANRIRPRTLF